jgi:hypothetical protein
MEQTTQIPTQNPPIQAETAPDPAPTYNPPNKLTKKQQAEWVERVVKHYKSSSTYIETYYKSMWTDMRKLYNSERVLVGYNGISDTFVPMSYSTVESLVASTAGDKPMVEYVPTRPDQQTNTEVLNNLFSYYWDLDGWTLKTIAHGRGLFKIGSSVMHAYWDIDHPVIRNIPIDDWFCDPTATFFNYQEAGYMGHRFLSKKSALEGEKIVDPVSGELIDKFMNLKKLGEERGDEDETSKEEEDMHRGSTLDKEARADEVEVICYVTLDEIVYVGNRQEVIYYDTNPFKARQQFLGVENPKGMYNYIFDAYTPEENQLYGRSVLQPILKPQELLNDLTNQNIDAVSWSLDPEMELDPMYSDYLDKMKSATGNIYPFKAGSYVPVQKLPIPSSVFNERTNIKNEIREATAIDELTRGTNYSHRTTATEAKIQMQQSSKRFDLAVSALENGGYYQMAKLVYQLIQHYVTTPTMFRVVGKNGVDWQTFDPNQFKGDYEPRVKLKVTLENEKDMKTRDIKEMFSAMVGNPYVDEAALTKFVIQKGFNLEPDEASTLVKKPEQIAQEQQGAAEGAQAAGKPPKSPEEIALEGIAKAYGNPNTAPDIKADIERMAGLQPSATHDTSMTSHLLEHMDTQHGALESMQTAVTPDSAMPALVQANQPPAAPTPPGAGQPQPNQPPVPAPVGPPVAGAPVNG